ncbi:MAG: hypothetical protein IPL71_08775 [Anaerolineales bacterium]|nr:hypothetical protein [Anaerolineales bacterium]
MTRGELIYLIPYFAALALSLGVLFYAWNRHSAQGAVAFSWYMIGQVLWIVSFILGLISSDISTKLFLDSLQWFAYIIIGITLPIFVIQYTEHKLRNSKLFFRIVLIAPIFLCGALIGNIFFDWIHQAPKIIPLTYFSQLTYDSTPIMYGYAVYIYAERMDVISANTAHYSTSQLLPDTNTAYHSWTFFLCFWHNSAAAGYSYLSAICLNSIYWRNWKPDYVLGIFSFSYFRNHPHRTR